MNSEPITLDSPFPFGKYRGQPLAVVLGDANYTKWMVEQVGIAEKFPNILNFIANAGGAAEKNQTPAHNKMQVRFLDEALLQALSEVLVDPGFVVTKVGKATFEFYGWDVRFAFESEGPGKVTQQKPGTHEWETVDGTTRETTRVNIELKPTISEDYPAVLRQVKQRIQSNRFIRTQDTAGLSVVITDDFTAASATLDQAKAMFKSSNITLLTWGDTL